jgi:hypothetical protein
MISVHLTASGDLLVRLLECAGWSYRVVGGWSAINPSTFHTPETSSAHAGSEANKSKEITLFMSYPDFHTHSPFCR